MCVLLVSWFGSCLSPQFLDLIAEVDAGADQSNVDDESLFENTVNEELDRQRRRSTRRVLDQQRSVSDNSKSMPGGSMRTLLEAGAEEGEFELDEDEGADEGGGGGNDGSGSPGATSSFRQRKSAGRRLEPALSLDEVRAPLGARGVCGRRV